MHQANTPLQSIDDLLHELALGIELADCLLPNLVIRPAIPMRPQRQHGGATKAHLPLPPPFPHTPKAV
jgi:hypothetical protein